MVMDKIKLLIVDSDTNFAETAAHFLSAFPDMDLLPCEQNGRDALHRIRTANPDAVLFDMLLPGLDGLSLLRSVNNMPNAPAMICCTRFYSDVALEAARTYGASYVLYKPVELNALHPVIVSCTEMLRKTRRMQHIVIDADVSGMQRNAEIRNYIVSLGIPAKLIGCSYLVEAVRFAQTDLSLTRNLSKGLYLETARSMNTTPSRVERCIRNAISTAFQSGALEGKMVTCPSNKEFINYILRNIDV